MDRTKLVDLDDQRLVATVAATVGVPRAEVREGLNSFVLHAPLELLGRAALLPLVAPKARDSARDRLIDLAVQYEASGPPVAPPAPVAYGSIEEASADLVAAASEGSADIVDSAAAWLGGHARPDQLARMLGDLFVTSLEAAGHANIYLALLARYQPRGLPGQMLRHPAHALAVADGRRIEVPSPLPVSTAAAVLTTLAGLDPIERPSSGFIAPLMQHSASHGIFDPLAATAGAPFELLRFAAQTMLQGSTDDTPYGWTHCLTLAHAPLLLADHGVGSSTATFVAAAYMAGFWAGLGEGRVDLAYVPEPVGVDRRDLLCAEPATAAAIAFHAPAGPEVAQIAAALATAASTHHDAHRVKYTLACLDAGTLDPPAQRLYLAAAAFLNAWWEQHDHEV